MTLVYEASKDDLVLAALAVLGGETRDVNERDAFLACWHAFPNTMRLCRLECDAQSSDRGLFDIVNTCRGRRLRRMAIRPEVRVVASRITTRQPRRVCARCAVDGSSVRLDTSASPRATSPYPGPERTYTDG